MSVDVFGRADTKSAITASTRGPPGIGYKLTQDGQYDVSKKRICNLADPLNNDDAVSLHILKKRMTNGQKKVKEDVTKNFESFIDNLFKQLDNNIIESRNIIVEKISENFKSEIEKLLQKLDSDISLTISVVDDFKTNVYKQISQIQNDLQNLNSKISLSSNDSIKEQ